MRYFRWCTDKFKVRQLKTYFKKDDIIIQIGFSIDERQRADNWVSWTDSEFPLIDLKLSANDCRDIIFDYGFPEPVKSSCYFCPFQRWQNWNWLKLTHPDLIQEAVEIEALYYERCPHDRHQWGLFGGKPLWKYAQGYQMEMPVLEEYSCWSGFCSH